MRKRILVIPCKANRSAVGADYTTQSFNLQHTLFHTHYLSTLNFNEQLGLAISTAREFELQLCAQVADAQAGSNAMRVKRELSIVMFELKVCV
jgi:hypothetical protein